MEAVARPARSTTGSPRGSGAGPARRRCYNARQRLSRGWRVEIGIGLDQSLGLSFAQGRAMVQEAARLGYTSAWTPAGATARDAFHICAGWWAASAEVVDGGITTGISVVPAPAWTVATLAMQAATVGELTGGRFVLGVGTGGVYSAEFRRTFGLPATPPITLMREYLVILRRLLAHETVNHEGKALSLRGIRLAFRPPPVPVYLAALGPQMLRLAGAAADGALLNWASPEQVAWSRRRIAEGAKRAGRDPATVRVVQYIRVCIDEDVAAARRAFTRALMGYALARPGASRAHGYRAHFARMGFDELLTELEARREAGATDEELLEAFPDELLRRVGYFGPAAGAAEAFRRLAEGLDTAIVRIVPPRPGVEAVRAALEACRPARILGA
jgi:alkanesulfonate monooxygenase SsuD/methylene tetrahydromethanopterin reductase-like flavin-dependent oxidoreductase (luciferase family)